MAETIKLHGRFSSPFLFRVIWALKIKGIPFEYVEEDLLNKSPSLLEYNPIHKKIPILVHCGKPICESLVIMEYIEETWPQNSLLPSDPYQRAVARFWIKFMDDKIPSIWKMFRAIGEEELEQTKKETLEMLQIMEEQGLVDSNNNKFFGGDKIGMVDIVIGTSMFWLGIVEELMGVTVLDAKKFPRLQEWNKNFMEVPEIKANLPNRDEILVVFKGYREKSLASYSHRK